MTRQSISYGLAYSDGTGEKIRDSWVKTENNFKQLWARRRPYRSGRRYIPGSDQVAATGIAPGVNSIRLFIAPIEDAVVVADMCARVSTTDAAGHFQMAAYAASAATDYPTGTPLVATGSLSTATGGLQKAVASGVWPGNWTVASPDFFWFALVTDSATAVFNSLSNTGLQLAHTIGVQGDANVMASVAGLFIANSGAFGTWPDFTSTSWTSANEATGANIPMVAFIPA